MKKSIILAAMLAAGAASAANLSWNITMGSVSRLDGATWSGANQGPELNSIYYAIVLAGDLGSAVTAINAENFLPDTTGGGENGPFLDWAGTTGIRGASATSAAPHTANSTKILASNQDYYAIAFVQEDGTGDWYCWISGIIEDKKGYTLSPDDGTALTTTSGLFNKGTGWQEVGSVVVPEPTSMALLALGAAAVGLRRKFCK